MITADEVAELHSARECVATMAGCCTPGDTGRPSSTPISMITLPGQCARQFVRSQLQRTLDRRSGAADGYRARQIRRSGRRRVLLHGHDHEQLIARTKELTDSSMPSGNALAATAFLRLGRLLGRGDYLDAAERTLAAALPIMQRAPMAAGQMLLALDRYLGPSNELVLVGDMARDDMKAGDCSRFIAVICRAVLLPFAIRAPPIRPGRNRGISTRSSRAKNRPTASRCCTFARTSLPGAGGWAGGD